MGNARGNFIYNNARSSLRENHKQEHKLLHEKVKPYFTGKYWWEYSYSYAITLLAERHREEYSLLIKYFKEEYAKRSIPSSKRNRSKILR